MSWDLTEAAVPWVTHDLAGDKGLASALCGFRARSRQDQYLLSDPESEALLGLSDAAQSASAAKYPQEGSGLWALGIYTITSWLSASALSGLITDSCWIYQWKF